MSTALGQLLHGNRLAVIAVENRLYDQLENHLDRYQMRRDPRDDALFDYVLYLCNGEDWITLRFSVNDTTAGYLFVEAVTRRIGKERI